MEIVSQSLSNLSNISINSLYFKPTPLNTNNPTNLSPIKTDFFLLNKPETYKDMLDGFINKHGINSNQVQDLRGERYYR
jgi:hypothetical protein